MTLRRLAAKIFKLTGAVVLAGFVLSLIWAGTYRFVEPPASFIMLRDRADGIAVRRSAVPLTRISEALPLAVIAAEDQKFCSHGGFDWAAIEDARRDIERGTRLRGASTISMQTAKNAFLWPARSYVRKAVEAYFTFLIESLWPKRRIIEVYLNLAEWGRGIYGAEAAARHYFGRSAAELTPRQASLLAAALPSPLRSAPDRPSRYLDRRAGEIARQLPTMRQGFAACLGRRAEKS